MHFFLLHAVHPTTPGTIFKLFSTAAMAQREGIDLLHKIGDDILARYSSDYGAEHHRAADWLEMKSDSEAIFDDVQQFVIDVDPTVEDEQTWFVDIRVTKVHGEEGAIKAAVTDAIETGVLAGAESIAASMPKLKPGENIELLPVGRERELHDALAIALGHVEHMAGFIGRLKAGYSFESLGEDFSQMRKALDARPIARHVERRVEQLGARLATEEPLPVALAMIDQIINIGGEAAMLARAGKKALAQIVYAGTELHASLGEAVERHVYDFDNGDVIEPGCTFTAAMRRWSDVMRGDPMVYATPSSPLPWRAVISDKRAYLTDAHDAGTGIIIENPTPSEKRNLLALLDAVNAQASIAMTPEVAVIIEGGVVQTIVGRNKGEPITVHIVDYDVDRGAEGEGIGQIPQTGGGEEPAKVSTYHPNNIEQAIEGGPFWQALREVRGA